MNINAFDDNVTNYKREIPQLFLTNAFCVLTNAIETKVGSITITNPGVYSVNPTTVTLSGGGPTSVAKIG